MLHIINAKCKPFAFSGSLSVTLSISVSVVAVVLNFFTFLTSHKPLHGFASNVVWMCLWWTPTKFVKIRVLPLFFMELWVICANSLKKSIKSLSRNNSYSV